MGNPVRFTSGFTQDASFQPLGQLGIPDPFFYADYADDFIHYNTGDYTVTAAGGTVAGSAAGGNGGRILFTTGATATNFAAIQLTAASFQYVATKKLAYLCRIQLADVTLPVVMAGLIQTTVTPYTVTDGIYFTKAAGSTDIVVNVVTGSTVIGTTTLTGLLTNATDIDLGFTVDRLGNILIYAGNSLIGQKRQDVTTLGPAAKILASSLTGAMTAVLLNPTLAIQTSTAAAKTMYADFHLAAMER